MAKKLIPLAGYVLIEPLDEQEVTASGLALPEKAQEKPEKGKVIAVGADIPYYEAQDRFGTNIDIRCPVKRGQTVIFHKWAGQDVREGNKEYKLVKFSDLMARYE